MQSRNTRALFVGKFDMKVTPGAAPRVTAGLNAPPEIVPTATAPARTVNPITNPWNQLFRWLLLVATFNTK